MDFSGYTFDANNERTFYEKLVSKIIPKKVLEERIKLTEGLSTKVDKDEIFIKPIGLNYYFIYTVNISEDTMESSYFRYAMDNGTKPAKKKDKKTYVMSNVEIVHVDEDQTYETIAVVREDKEYEDPHKDFSERMAKGLGNLIENKTYMLHYQSKNEALSKFCKHIIRKQRGV